MVCRHHYEYKPDMTTPSSNRVRYLDEADERIHPNVRLPRHLIEDLDRLPGSRTEKIERAVREFLDTFHGWRPKQPM